MTEPQPTSEKVSPDELVAANEDAATYYRRHLLGSDAQGPRDYLIGRGFAAVLEDTPWTVGHAPASWTALYDHLADLGYSDQTMLAAGLVTLSRRGTPIDRFRNRITFGIRNLDGQLVGFTARSAPGAGETVPRYLNTARTPLFDKSSVMFGLGEMARSSLAETSLVLVEGPLDAIAADLANTKGIDRLAPLALCGTALTTRHTELLTGLAPKAIIVAFDDDPAGARAAQHAYFQLRPSTTHLRAARLEDHRDPADELERSGPANLRVRLTADRPLADRVVDDYLATWPNVPKNAEATICALRGAARLVSQMSPNDISRQATRLASRLRLSDQTVTRELCAAVSLSAAPSRPHLTPACSTTRGGVIQVGVLGAVRLERPSVCSRNGRESFWGSSAAT